jgi:hypothetical protein
MSIFAEFFSDAATALSLDHFGFFRQGKVAYQMVPKGGSREVILTLSGGTVRMASANPNIVQIGPPNSDEPSDKNLMTFPSGGGLDKRFKLHGADVGRTLVIVEDSSGKPINKLIVSVKQKVVKKYQTVILQDIRRRSQRSFDDLRSIMSDVNTIYSRQANLELQQVHDPMIVYTEQDLGDPIDLSLWGGSYLDWLADHIKRKNDSVGAAKQDFTLVSTWNLKDDDPDSLAGIYPGHGSMVFCEDLVPNSGLLNASLFAHELAHAFQCAHRLDPPELLMQLNIGSCRMSDREIDKINPTGNK